MFPLIFGVEEFWEVYEDELTEYAGSLSDEEVSLIVYKIGGE